MANGRCVRLCAVIVCLAMSLCAAARAGDQPQYTLGDVKIPPASAEEPLRTSVSFALAEKYLEQGSLAWNAERKCVTCHTNGTYMTIRPALTPSLGQPAETTREFFLNQLASLAKEERATLMKSTRPAQVIYLAAGLAEWDARITKTLSPETKQALALMFELQTEQGTWGTLDCWPPYESDAFHEATVAAMAIGVAPGWLELAANDPALMAKVDRLKTYLRTTPPPHDYGRVLLLWASARWPGLLDQPQQQSLREVVLKHQRDDGGWSIRTFASPDAWGRGNRAAKLRAEPDFSTPASDGHMTGLAIIVLRETGVATDNPQVQRGVKWLQTNQRESGRWWTRSLNTDSWHFITYSGTAYPLLALQLCDVKP
jgi:squalene-hopene/tetraprenyl-beta-curcumene cyclase